MESWIFGEKRIISAPISVTVSGATYEVFDALDDSIVSSGDASVGDSSVSFLWEPLETSIYVARISYITGNEKYSYDQVIEIRETM